MAALSSERPAGPDLPEWLREDAPLIQAGGNTPLRLSGEGVWLVETGKVQVFACREDTDEPRFHLATVGAGGLLFGAREIRGFTLLAVGGRDSSLRDLGMARVRRMVEDPAFARSLAPLLEKWISGLLTEALRTAPPKAFQELRAGEELFLEAEGKVARPREDVAWVRCTQGTCWLLGQKELALTDGDLLPVPELAWLTAAGEARISCLATADVLRQGELWVEGLNRFFEIFLTYVDLQIDKLVREERVRLGHKADLDQATVGSAYSRLASVLTGLPYREIELDEIAEPLLGACRFVGQALGIRFRAPVETTAGIRQKDRLAAICSASQVRYRRVILRGDWWRRDNGPLVAFRFLDAEQKQRRAVALLPTSVRGYEMVDPVDRTRQPVDKAVAETLSGDGFMFYPPLPARALKKGDLLRAALRDRGTDLLTIAAMGVCGGLMGLLVPVVTGLLFGRVIPSGNRSQLLPLILALILGALASSAFQVTRSIAVLRLGGKMDGAVQAAVWDRLLALPADFFRRFSVGDLANRSMGIDAMRELLTGNVVTSVLAAIFSLFSFALLFYYSWRLALLATGLVIVLMGVTILLVWLQVGHQRDLFRLQGKVASLLFGVLGGLSKLRVGGAVPRAFALWAQRFAEQRQHTIAAQRIAIAQTTVNACYGVLTSLALFAMVGLSSEASLPIGDFLAFNTAFGQFLGAALSMIGVFSSVLTMVPIYERLLPILEEMPEVDGSKADAGDLSGEIELSHVSFRYPGDGPLDPRRCVLPGRAGRVHCPGWPFGRRQVDLPAADPRLRAAPLGLDLPGWPGSRRARRAVGAAAARRGAPVGPAHGRGLVHGTSSATPISESTMPGKRPAWRGWRKTSRPCRWACIPSSAEGGEHLLRRAATAAADRPRHCAPAAAHPVRRGHERPRQPHPGDREPQPGAAESDPHRHCPPSEHDRQRRSHLRHAGWPRGRVGYLRRAAQAWRRIRPTRRKADRLAWRLPP